MNGDDVVLIKEKSTGKVIAARFFMDTPNHKMVWGNVDFPYEYHDHIDVVIMDDSIRDTFKNENIEYVKLFNSILFGYASISTKNGNPHIFQESDINYIAEGAQLALDKLKQLGRI